MAAVKLRASGAEKCLSAQEQQAKINEIRKLMGPIVSKFPVHCSEASMIRYLRARNWNTKKASKMMKETLKWRLQYRPEEIRWEDVAHEAKTGKLYRADYVDKLGRIVLIMRPGFQSTSSVDSQIRYLVYCLERAIAELGPGQEQMVWLIDFERWNMSSTSVKVTRETAHVLQNHYPERLGLAILYNPPKVFESFWSMVKPFLEPRTTKKVKFVFNNNRESLKIMEELFDMNTLESIFGGRNLVRFNYEAYANRMMEEDRKRTSSPRSGGSPPCASLLASSGPASEASDEGDLSSDDETSRSIEGSQLGRKAVANASTNSKSHHVK